MVSQAIVILESDPLRPNYSLQFGSWVMEQKGGHFTRFQAPEGTFGKKVRFRLKGLLDLYACMQRFSTSSIWKVKLGELQVFKEFVFTIFNEL